MSFNPEPDRCLLCGRLLPDDNPDGFCNTCSIERERAAERWASEHGNQPFDPEPGILPPGFPIPQEDADRGRAGAAKTTATAAWDALPATERAGYLAYLADDARDVRNDKTDFGPRWIRILRAVSDALARPDAPSAFASPRKEPER